MQPSVIGQLSCRIDFPVREAGLIPHVAVLFGGPWVDRPFTANAVTL